MTGGLRRVLDERAFGGGPGSKFKAVKIPNRAVVGITRSCPLSIC